MPARIVTVIGDLDGPGELLNTVVDTHARLVVAAPADNGDLLFEAIGELPARCATVALLPVPSFRIQSAVLTSRFDIRCLPLTVGPTEFRAAIEQVLNGEAPLLTVEEVAAAPRGSLTPREQEVLRELTLGKPNRQIAESLWLSENTVKTHLHKIYHKLGVSNRAEAVSLYLSELGSA
jgi:DNA-binding NarL/FixJ family response regulator